jgi:hypothetical protein
VSLTGERDTTANLRRRKEAPAPRGQQGAGASDRARDAPRAGPGNQRTRSSRAAFGHTTAPPIRASILKSTQNPALNADLVLERAVGFAEQPRLNGNAGILEQLARRTHDVAQRFRLARALMNTRPSNAAGWPHQVHQPTRSKINLHR